MAVAGAASIRGSVFLVYLYYWFGNGWREVLFQTRGVWGGHETMPIQQAADNAVQVCLVGVFFVVFFFKQERKKVGGGGWRSGWKEQPLEPWE